MGRHEKEVGIALGVDRRDSGYYSTPAFVAELIADKVTSLNPTGSVALDPCVGRGELARPLAARNVAVQGFDVLPFDAPPGVDFRQQDFLEFYAEKKATCPLGKQLQLPFDYYIANPPYNCHEVSYIRDNKEKLSYLFAEVGVLNMYSMFLSAMIDCAKEGAVIGVITLDSFLTARAHSELRQQILRQCAVHYLALCPTDLFLDQGADVRTCIMIMQKGKRFQRSVQVANRPSSAEEFEAILADELFEEVTLEEILLDHAEDRSELVVGVPSAIKNAFRCARLGSLFRCATGISTGNDKKYLRKEAVSGYSIPFYKNPGSRKFYAPPNCYLIDDFAQQEQIVGNFLVRNKDLLFQSGLTCSSMGVPFGACYLPPNSTFGVNANIILPEEDTWWMMSYLNSRFVTFLVRGVLSRTNMITSGYVARIPVPDFSKRTKERLTEIAKAALAAQVDIETQSGYVDRIDEVLQVELGLPNDDAQYVRSFAENLVRAT